MLTKRWVEGVSVAGSQGLKAYEVRCPFCGKDVRIEVDSDGIVVLDRSTLCTHCRADCDQTDDGVELLFINDEGQEG